MNFIKLLFISLLLVSCNQKITQEEQDQTEIENSEDLAELEPEIVESMEAVAIANLKILTPNVYRDYLKTDLSQLDESWRELYFDESKNKWFVDKASFKISRDFDHCAGDSITLVLSNRNGILFFKGMETPLKEIQAVIPARETMYPERPFSFNFGSGEYSLNANGKVKLWGQSYLSSEEIAELEEESFSSYHIDNYTLKLKKIGSGSQEIFRTSVSPYDCPILCWIGDLDQDGKPDFIFDTPDEGRNNTVELYLSSQAENDDHIKKVAEIYTSTDC